MDQDDPETRIADLERQVAEQKRLPELERQLADTRASILADYGVEQPLHVSDTQTAARQSFVFAPQRRPQPFGGIGSQPGFEGKRTIRGQTWPDRQPSRRNLLRAKLSNNIGGGVGVCIGGAAVLTAVFPSTALWTSRVVCRSPYQLTYGTSGYSYRPGQSGTSVSFRCVGNAGSYKPNEFFIFGLQSLLVTVVVCATVVVAGLLWRLVRKRR
jgi:hypothetical protein